MSRQDNACTAIHSCQLFYCDGVAHYVQTRTAVFLGIWNSHQSHFSQLFHRFRGKFVALVQHKCNWLNLFLRESTNLCTQLLMSRCGLIQHMVTSFSNNLSEITESLDNVSINNITCHKSLSHFKLIILLCTFHVNICVFLSYFLCIAHKENRRNLISP